MYPPHILYFSALFLSVNAAGPSVESWTLAQHGTTGVSAMQLVVVSETKALILDKVEANPLLIGVNRSAWAVEYDLNTDQVRALHPISNTFCAGGAFLSNGTFLSTGGNPVILPEEDDLSGLDSLRLFTPCDDGKCDLIEGPTLRMTSNRWYPSATRLDDGSVLIFGGSFAGGAFIDNVTISNPSFEFFPPKAIHGFNGTRIPSAFMNDTLNANHFPITFLLPDGRLFIASNNASMLFDWRTNTEVRLPHFPNGARVTSPFSASAVLLPLTPENNYIPEVLFCGGSFLNDFAPVSTYSVDSPTVDFCTRMVLSPQGIAKGWQVESMGSGRIMTDALLLPDGCVFLVNGAHTGFAGFGSAPDAIGQSSANNTAFTPLLYDPSAPAGARFTSAGLPTSSIARMYHSSASLTPSGDIFIAGSNPNNPDIGLVGQVKFPTEYRAEWFSPPFKGKPRPSFSGSLPQNIGFGKSFTVNVDLPPGTTSVSASLMDLGFSTHAVHMNQRLVKLRCQLSSNKKAVTITGPPDARIYPPGPAFLFLVTNAGVSGIGKKVMVGSGRGPPVDKGALANMLAQPIATAVAGW